MLLGTIGDPMLNAAETFATFMIQVSMALLGFGGISLLAALVSRGKETRAVYRFVARRSGVFGTIALMAGLAGPAVLGAPGSARRLFVEGSGLTALAPPDPNPGQAPQIAQDGHEWSAGTTCEQTCKISPHDARGAVSMPGCTTTPCAHTI